MSKISFTEFYNKIQSLRKDSDKAPIVVVNKTLCPSCGKQDVQKRDVQMRSLDEGQSTVAKCNSCSWLKVEHS